MRGNLVACHSLLAKPKLIRITKSITCIFVHTDMHKMYELRVTPTRLASRFCISRKTHRVERISRHLTGDIPPGGNRDQEAEERM